MNKIKIIIDSTCDLTPEYIKEHDIEVVPLLVTHNGNEYKDGAHLHFEIAVDGKNVDPAVYLTLEEK